MDRSHHNDHHPPSETSWRIVPASPVRRATRATLQFLTFAARNLIHVDRPKGWDGPGRIRALPQGHPGQDAAGPGPLGETSSNTSGRIDSPPKVVLTFRHFTGYQCAGSLPPGFK